MLASIFLLSLCFSDTYHISRPLFDEKEQGILDTYKSSIFKPILDCPTNDHRALLECARTAFAKSFAPFENDWKRTEALTQAPADIEEIKEDSSECIINCILKKDHGDLQKCLTRCERVMEGASQVAKRKALFALNKKDESEEPIGMTFDAANVEAEMFQGAEAEQQKAKEAFLKMVNRRAVPSVH
ncbi:uncharacterized protein MONOS_890 [Monocercomonoides exilis]|uniref:uncharacterized protein n=1 Tax=Monocercomonoides exilis TaxID=2049356 RepID=UPI00355A81F1|nr:hypothetical protein MONOS_890 [Monocercomonoides exilis]|eukprot:MONOS_890.1-p1 / transcript=MONOS_890.1 / gene=MONOS_890 / organism=Monocercomonoides_exilis_PA203 / gene_product=unspecified product / transcript_product=unspecified product / location=Mono_scaffold00014:241313-241932(-) / protein_length=186 / sequence_SO=supercontig / SO=protein_coding / is_pseudo=false